MTDFERSIDRAVNRDIAHVLEPFGTADDDAYRVDKFAKLRHAATILCRRMQHAIPTMIPSEVLAIIGLVLRKDEAAQAYTMVTRALLSMGWSVSQTMQAYENFCRDNPEMYDWRLARLFSRAQLHATYGIGHGDMIADMLVDPRTYPLMYAIMYGNITEPVPLVFRTALVPLVLPFDKLFLSTMDEWLHQLSIPAFTNDTLEGHFIDTPAAKRLYEGATDGNLATSLTLSNDHGLYQTTETEEALRQANRR